MGDIDPSRRQLSPNPSPGPSVPSDVVTAENGKNNGEANLDQLQRLYIHDLSIEFRTPPEDPFDLSCITVVESNLGSDQCLNLTRASSTLWKQIGTPTAFVLEDITLFFRYQDECDPAIFFLPRETLTKLADIRGKTQHVEGELDFGDPVPAAKIFLQVGFNRASVERKDIGAITQVANIATAERQFHGGSMHPPDGDVVSEFVILEANIQAKIIELMNGHLDSPTVLQALLDSPDDLPQKPFLWGLYGVVLMTLASDGHPPDLESALFAFEMRRQLCFMDGTRPNGSWKIDLTEAKAYQQRCGVTGQTSDLDRAIQILEDVAPAAALQDDQVWLLHSTLGTIYLQRSSLSASLVDINSAVAYLQTAVGLTPRSDPDFLSWHSNLGSALLSRFKQTGDINDLGAAITSHSTAADLMQASHPDFLSVHINLSSSFLARFKRTSGNHALDAAITSHRRAILIMPAGHPNLPSLQDNLGKLLRTSFERTGDTDTLDAAVASHRIAVNLTPANDPDLASCNDSLGISLLTRFTHLVNVNDLNGAIASHRRAVDLTPAEHPDLPSRLNNLGISLKACFEHTGDTDALEASIANYRRAVDLTPANHPDHPSWHYNLGNGLTTRFEHTGDIDDLKATITSYRIAVDLTPSNHANLPSRYNNLGNALNTWFKHSGDGGDLEAAIAGYRRAIELTPANDHDLPSWHYNLGTSFFVRFNHAGDIRDLEAAIASRCRAVELMPADHPDLSSRLINLGSLLLTRLEHPGDVGHLEDVIAGHSRVIRVTSASHPSLPSLHSSLGKLLRARFDRTGEIDDLNAAITSHLRALELSPPDHPDIAAWHGELGSELHTRSLHTGSADDFKATIMNCRRAVELTPADHPDLPTRHNQLGQSLLSSFQHTGDIDELEAAITSHRRAFDLMPPDHPHLPFRYDYLATSLFARSDRTGDMNDLEAAIASQRRAIELTPADDSSLPARHHTLGISLRSRYRRSGDIDDLKASITSHRRAIELTPAGDAELPSRYSNLGSSLMFLFEHSGDADDIEAAIASHRRAVDLTPAGHTDLASWHTNLGSSHLNFFKYTGDIDHLGAAIASHHNAVDLTPAGHPNIAPLFSLGLSYQHRGDQGLPLALQHFRAAALTTSGAPSLRLKAAKNWAECCRVVEKHNFSAPFAHLINLLTEIASIEQPVELRHENLRQNLSSHLVAEAAAVALSYSRPDLALEWLEQGRCLVWSQLNQLRSPIEELRLSDRHLADEFEQISTQLEKGGARGRVQSGNTTIEALSLQEEASQYVRLAARRKSLLEEIQRLPRFEHFLRPRPASYFLNNLPDEGPIVLINAHTEHCDAIVLIKGFDEPLHISLPDITLKKATHLCQLVRGCLADHWLRTRDISDRGLRLVGDQVDPLLYVLKQLWMCMVKPLLDGLGFIRPPATRRRIWWCPTGPFAFLPIHAAGIYKGLDCCSLFDYVISSYIPTITTLLDKKSKMSLSSTLLLVSQSAAPSLSRIPGADHETAALLEKMKTRGVKATRLFGEDATVQGISDNMEIYSSIHLACHGSQEAGKPLESGFYLKDGCLQLSSIIKKALPNADFAFLSACQTSTGDQQLSDEAVHLAAGMLASGYRSVVGTMWSIQDNYGTMVAEKFYENLLDRSSACGKLGIDSSQAAYALDTAIKHLQNIVGDSPKGLLTWLPYVHFGV